jgi:hypothetical protein
VPRPAPRPAPGPPRIPLAVLSRPALTGTEPADLDACTAAAEIAAGAARARDLRARRGGPAKHKGEPGPKPKIATPDLVTAYRILSYLPISRRALAPFLGAPQATFNQSLNRLTRALADIPPPPALPPPPTPPRTRDQLIAYAASHGIDLTIPPPGQEHTAPQATVATPDTP